MRVSTVLLILGVVMSWVHLGVVSSYNGLIDSAIAAQKAGATIQVPSPPFFVDHFYLAVASWALPILLGTIGVLRSK